MKKIDKNTIKTPEQLKNIFLANKDNLKYINQTIIREYQTPLYITSKNLFYCKETDTEFFINGIGAEKINIESYYYTWQNLFKMLKQDYTKNSNLINSFFLVFFKNYQYKPVTDELLEDIIRNRENCQFLTVKEIPKYIILSKIIKLCNKMELPFIRGF